LPPFFVCDWLASLGKRIRSRGLAGRRNVRTLLQIGTDTWSATLQRLNRFGTGFELKLYSLNRPATEGGKNNS
jgi:hypothetical protein